MRKPIVFPTAVRSPRPIAPHVESLTLEWSAGRYVLIHPECMERMSRYTTGPEHELEAGGIFLGSYRGPHIEISAITEPKPGDRRGRYVFDRSDPGHQTAAKSAWRKSSRTTTFTGEWHTHPEDVPTPSGIDLRTWRDLMKKSKEPLVFIILGWSGNWYGIGHERRILPARSV